jgi:hypothetical protein
MAYDQFLCATQGNTNMFVKLEERYKDIRVDTSDSNE